MAKEEEYVFLCYSSKNCVHSFLQVGEETGLPGYWESETFIF